MKLELELNGREEEFEVDADIAGEYIVARKQKPGGRKESRVRLLGRTGSRWTLEIDGRIEDVLVSSQGNQISVDWRNRNYPMRVLSFRERLVELGRHPDLDGTVELRAQMPGKVVQVLKSIDEKVEAGDGLIIIESMKMQNELKSPKTGRVVTCCVKEGATVNAGDLLFEVE